MKVLLGTSNPSKAAVFAEQLMGYGLEFLTLADLEIAKQPDENGKDPMENAMVKAAYYGQFFDPVIAEDSALYIRELPLDDPRQPGLTIRKTADGRVMTDDEEMLAYYTELVHSLGGKVTACYLDGYAVYKDGKVTGFMDNSPERLDTYSFYLVDKPSEKRHPGWPLDSISIDPQTGSRFTDDWAEMTSTRKAATHLYKGKLTDFYLKALGIMDDSGEKA